MTLIEWRDEFKTGILSADHEHETLIALLNELHARLGASADEAEIEDFLGEVYARIAAHFALEERHMRAARYDDYVEHKRDHDRLLDEIRAIMDRQVEGGYRSTIETLGRELHDWFVVHFSSKDRRLHLLLERPPPTRT